MNKKYTAATLVVVMVLASTIILVFQHHPPKPEQAQSPHEPAHHTMEAAQEATPDTTQAVAYYQAESTRRMAERLRKLADEANPETNIYANDKRLLYFKNKTRPPELGGQLQLDALIATVIMPICRNERLTRRAWWENFICPLPQNKMLPKQG